MTDRKCNCKRPAILEARSMYRIREVDGTTRIAEMLVDLHRLTFLMCAVAEF